MNGAGLSEPRGRRRALHGNEEEAGGSEPHPGQRAACPSETVVTVVCNIIMYT